MYALPNIQPMPEFYEELKTELDFDPEIAAEHEYFPLDKAIIDLAEWRGDLFKRVSRTRSPGPRRQNTRRRPARKTSTPD